MAADLGELFQDVVDFCLIKNATNVFLVEGRALRHEDWGRSVSGLADLRLIHDIGRFSVSTPGHAGRRYVGFMLDLSTWASERAERFSAIEFWQETDKDRVRRQALVYRPVSA